MSWRKTSGDNPDVVSWRHSNNSELGVIHRDYMRDVKPFWEVAFFPPTNMGWPATNFRRLGIFMTKREAIAFAKNWMRRNKS